MACRARADAENETDLLVALAFADPVQDLGFALCETLRLGTLA